MELPLLRELELLELLLPLLEETLLTREEEERLCEDRLRLVALLFPDRVLLERLLLLRELELLELLLLLFEELPLLRALVVGVIGLRLDDDEEDDWRGAGAAPMLMGLRESFFIMRTQRLSIHCTAGTSTFR